MCKSRGYPITGIQLQLIVTGHLQFDTHLMASRLRDKQARGEPIRIQNVVIDDNYNRIYILIIIVIIINIIIIILIIIIIIIIHQFLQTGLNIQRFKHMATNMWRFCLFLASLVEVHQMDGEAIGTRRAIFRTGRQYRLACLQV